MAANNKEKTNRLTFKKFDKDIDEKISQAEFRIALGEKVGPDKANAMIRAGSYITKEGGQGIANVVIHGAHTLASHGATAPHGLPAVLNNIFKIVKAPAVYIYRFFVKPTALVDHVAEAKQFLKDVNLYL